MDSFHSTNSSIRTEPESLVNERCTHRILPSADTPGAHGQPVIRLPLLIGPLSLQAFKYTVEPPNKGHFGISHVVLCREVVLFSEVQNVWEWYFEECPLQRGCPFLGGSFIGGSTVVIMSILLNLVTQTAV